MYLGSEYAGMSMEIGIGGDRYHRSTMVTTDKGNDERMTVTDGDGTDVRT